MRYEKALALIDYCSNQCPVIQKQAQAGDSARAHETLHDISHYRNVLAKVFALIEAYERDHGPLDVETKVCALMGALLHDIGSSIDPPNHDVAGARWAGPYLKNLYLPGDPEQERLPAKWIARIQRVIIGHRSHRYLAKKTSDIALDFVFLADKMEGDNNRVRPGPARWMRILRWVWLAWLIDHAREGGEHDRANFAIRKATPLIERGVIVLVLEIDTWICKPSLIYNLWGNPKVGGKIHGERFHGCAKAARNLGYEFGLVFNGVQYAWNKKVENWVPVARA